MKVIRNIEHLIRSDFVPIHEKAKRWQTHSLEDPAFQGQTVEETRRRLELFKQKLLKANRGHGPADRTAVYGLSEDEIKIVEEATCG
jgi:hypothetical protein